MTFDEHSIAHLMSVLTDLYSNPTMAVVREYSTNAWDAHIAAGNPAPIQVTLPDQMTNMLVIKDFGTGMSKDDITDHFSKYGWSSKRDSDEEVGMLGLGCKSGLTYTSQFTLVTIQDGIKNTVLVTREESGGGIVQVIDTVSTEEPNGTEVQMPCKDWNEMSLVTHDFFQYWERGTVLVNGEEPACIWDAAGAGAIRLDDDIIMLPHDQNNRAKKASMLVMGGVAYPIQQSKLPYEMQRNDDRMRAIVRVPIGTINFVPSREALTYNKRTLETITDAWNFIYAGMGRMVQAKIDAAPNAKEAWRIWMNWRYVAQKAKLHYNGTPFVDSIDVPDKMRTLILPIQASSWSNSDRSERVSYNIDVRKAYECVLHVVGHQGTAIAASTKARMRLYAEQHGLTKGNILVYPKIFGAPWLTNATVNRVRFDVIKAIQLPDVPDKIKTVRQRAKYRTLISHGDLEYSDELPETVKCWLPAVYNSLSRTEVRDFAGSNTVAVVLAADEKRFLRDHPDIPTWQEWTHDRIKTVPMEGSDWDNFHWHADRDADYKQLPHVPRFVSHVSETDFSLVMDADLRELIIGYEASRKPGDRFKERMYAVLAMDRKLQVIAPKVPTSAQFAVIKRMRARYEGLLDIGGLSYEDTKVLIKALNAFYIIKAQLNVIPVL